jgi:hypothetical protein
MARSEKKNKKVGENLILGIAIGAASAAVIVFLVWLLITVFKPEAEEEKDIYESYYHLTTVDFENILKVNTGLKDDSGQPYQYDSLLNTDPTNLNQDKNKLYDLVMDSDVIYILVFSSTNNHGRADEDTNTQISDAIKGAVINKIDYNVFEKVDEEGNPYNSCFLVFDYRGGDFSIIENYWSFLYPTVGANPAITSHSTVWNVDYYGVSGVIAPWLIEIKSSEISTSYDVPEIHVWAGVKGKTNDYFYLELLPQLNKINKDEEE